LTAQLAGRARGVRGGIAVNTEVAKPQVLWDALDINNFSFLFFYFYFSILLFFCFFFFLKNDEETHDVMSQA